MFNCVNWISEQAVKLGLRLPSPHPAMLGTWLPSSFLQAMINANVGYADHVAEADGTMWTGATFQGDPHGSGTMAWPNANFHRLGEAGHRARGITSCSGGIILTEPTRLLVGLLLGTFKWQGDAQFAGRTSRGRSPTGLYQR